MAWTLTIPHSYRPLRGGESSGGPGRPTRQDNVPLLAAGVALYAFLAIFPTLIAAITLYGLVADPAEVERQITSLARALPAEATQVISGELHSLAAGSPRALSVGLVVSLLLALWTASTGTSNLIKAVNLAYDEEDGRGFVKGRAVALLLTLGAIVFLAVAAALVAVLPAVLGFLGLGPLTRAFVEVARWAGLVVFVMIALAILYRYAPDREHPRFAWTSVGAIVATLLWVLGSAGFSVFAGTVGNYGRTYGALAGVAMLLLWLLLTSFAVLLGAEINSEMEHQTAQDTTHGPQRPMGERRAVKADALAE
jgi:membrane protein